MTYELKLITLEDASNQDIYFMLQEIPKNDHGFENHAHGLTIQEFQSWVKQKIDESHGNALEDGFVQQTYCWFYVDNQVVGLGKIRHHLTDRLRLQGGHIGYALRPSARGKGFGKIWLSLLMQQAEKFGIRDILITCNPNNLASRKVIEANGGKLESEDGHTSRFWIRTNN